LEAATSPFWEMTLPVSDGKARTSVTRQQLAARQVATVMA